MKKIAFLPLWILLIISCQSTPKNNSGTLGLLDKSARYDAVEEAPASPAEADDENLVPRIKQPDKIIKEANIKFEVDDYKSAKRAIDSLVQRWGGYISNEDERYSSNRITNTIIIRVLNTQFENLLNAIGETSKKIDYKTVNSMDVTEEYVDIISRLKTKREVEQRYYEILRKASKVEDILKIENEIRVLREEIESQEGRLKYLEDRVSFSTITLTIYQELEYKYKPRKDTNFFSRFYKALDKGWKGLLSFFIALVHIWPIILLGATGLILVFRRRKSKNK